MNVGQLNQSPCTIREETVQKQAQTEAQLFATLAQSMAELHKLDQLTYSTVAAGS